MISTFTFTKNSLAARMRALDPAWRFVLGTFLAARAWFLIWPVVVSAIIPMAVQNLTLFGAPVVAAFELPSSERYVYSRLVDRTTLSFRAAAPGYVTDLQTGSLWSLREGRALTGPHAGRMLDVSLYTVEDVFPYHGAAADPSPLLALWQRFDTNWYLKIAERGYSTADGSTVYFPLYPLSIRLLGSLLFGRDLLAATLISNFALIGALYFLFRISSDLIGEAGARRTLAYLVIFPTSLFLFAPYTESPFLCMSLAAIYAAQQRHWLAAGVLGALAAFARFQGVVLILPLAYLWWKHVAGARGQAVGGKSGASSFTSKALSGAALLLIPLACLTFLAATNLSLLTSYEGQLHARFVMPWDNLMASIQLIGQGAAGMADVLNLGAAIAFAAMCVVVWAKLPRVHGLYVVVMFLAPLFRMTTQQPLVSTTRYVLILFPVFIVWAMWGENRWVNRAAVYLSLPLNLYLSAQFFLWGWVA